MKNRILALFLALCLVLPITAVSEEVVDEYVQDIAEPVLEEVIEEAVAVEEVQEEPVEEEIPVDESINDIVDEVVLEDAADVVEGYVRIEAAANIYTDSELTTACGMIAHDSIVYAVPAAAGVLLVNFDTEDLRAAGENPASAYIAGDKVTFLTAEETEELLAALSEEEGIRSAGEHILPAVVVKGTDEPKEKEQLTCDVEDLRLAKGDSYTLKVNVSEGVTFTSEDDTVAKVTAAGKVSAIAVGSTKITIDAGEEGKIIVPVEVVAPVAKLSVTADAKTIGVGESVQLYVTSAPEADIDTHYAYGSSDKKVAVVSGDGVVTAVKAGTATITVKAYNGKKASIKITVKKAPVSVGVSTDKDVLGIGDKCGTKVTFGKSQGGTYQMISGNEDVLTVKDGIVTAVGVGTAEIIVETFNGKTASTEITVVPAPESMSISKTALKIGKGDKTYLTAALNEGTAGDISWISDNEKIVKIDQKGKITAVKTGTAIVEASTYNGVRATCEVTVVSAPAGVAITAVTKTIGVGQTLQLSAAAKPDPDVVTTFKWATSNKKIATVSSDGQMKAKKAGTVKITAKTYNGKKAVIKIKVVKVDTEAIMTFDAEEYNIGDVITPSVVFSTGDAAEEYSLTTSDPNVAVVNEDGELVAVGSGRCTVTAVCYGVNNGLEASAEVFVFDGQETASFTAELPEEICAGKPAKVQTVMSGWHKNVCITANGEVMEVAADGSFMITLAEQGENELLIVVDDGISRIEETYTVNVGDSFTAGDFRFSMADGKLAVVKYLGSAEHIIVPGEQDGYPVIELAAGAFEGNGTVIEITLPKTITKVSARAFKDCAKLEKVN